MKKEKTTQFLMKPKVDFCFKELMQDEEVRNAFLAAVLGINLEEIVESRILPSHLRQKDKDDKLGILDVRVLLNNKEQIDIEIQVTSSEYWAERTKEEFEMAAGKSEYIKKAYEDLNRISADEEKRLEYEARERAIRDHQYFSTVYKETGLREGRKEGLKIGRQEGLQEGRQEGRQEGIQAVVELLQEMGMEKEIVCVKIQERFQFSLSDAAKEVEKYWKS